MDPLFSNRKDGGVISFSAEETRPLCIEKRSQQFGLQGCFRRLYFMAITLDLARMTKKPQAQSTFVWISGKGNPARYYDGGTAGVNGGYNADKSYAASYGGWDGQGGYDLLTFSGTGDPSLGSNFNAAKLDDNLIIQGSGSNFAWEIDLSSSGANITDHEVTVYGSTKADTITGGEKASKLYGGGGNDIILAGSDNSVFGGAGNDILIANKNTSDDAKLSGVAGNNFFAVQKDAKVTITDFHYGKDVIGISTSSIGTSLSSATFENFGEDLVDAFGYGGATIDSARDYRQYTVVNNSGTKTNVAAVKQGSSFVDLSSATDSFQIFGGKLKDNEGNNTLHGGLKADTIYADRGDFIYGGGGDDLIRLQTVGSDDRTAERVALTSAGGKDTVEYFDTGWDEGDDIVWFYDKAAEVSDVSVDSNGNMVLKQGRGQLTLKNVVDQEKLKVQDANGLYKVGYTGSSNSFTDADATADIYLGTAKKNDTISFVGAEGDIVADLGNTGKYTGSARYTSIEAVVGGSGDNTLVGAANVDNTISAGMGNASIYGGGKSNDLLVATGAAVDAGKTTTFFFGAGDGKDTITGFHATEDTNPDTVRDVLAFYSGEVTSIKKANTELTINLKDHSSLKLVNAFTGLYDSLIGVNVGGQTSFAKVTGANEIVHYNAAAKYYISANGKGTVENNTDGSKIYLDGRTGDAYKGFTDIHASLGSELELAGDAGKNVVEYAGDGTASLYGGAGDDTLIGSTSTNGQNTFFFGKKDGNDIIEKSTAKDKVMLYDVTLDDIRAAKVENNVLKASLKTGGSLTVKNFATANCVNDFALADGTSWSYSGGTWTQKTASEE